MRVSHQLLSNVTMNSFNKLKQDSWTLKQIKKIFSSIQDGVKTYYKYLLELKNRCCTSKILFALKNNFLKQSQVLFEQIFAEQQQWFVSQADKNKTFACLYVGTCGERKYVHGILYFHNCIAFLFRDRIWIYDFLNFHQFFFSYLTAQLYSTFSHSEDWCRCDKMNSFLIHADYN